MILFDFLACHLRFPTLCLSEWVTEWERPRWWGRGAGRGGKSGCRRCARGRRTRARSPRRRDAARRSARWPRAASSARRPARALTGRRIWCAAPLENRATGRMARTPPAASERDTERTIFQGQSIYLAWENRYECESETTKTMDTVKWKWSAVNRNL